MNGAFTGERLHAGDALFAVDLARHQAAYRFALGFAGGGRVLDYGCGSGHGTAELLGDGATIVGLDQVAPDPGFRGAGGRFVRGDVQRPPLAPGAFDLVLSFQVIEHLREPGAYVEAMARLLRPGGVALLSTPNRLTSDGENPFHVHEYTRDELATVLGRAFREVEMRGVGATQAVARYYAERLRRIRRITRLDPLRLRHRLPSGLIHWLFGRFAVRVRRGIQGSAGLPDATWNDFPVGPPEDGCLDLLAICRLPCLAG